MPASGPLIDRFGAAPVVIAGNLVSAVGTADYLAVTRVWPLVIVALLASAGGRLYWTARSATA